MPSIFIWKATAPNTSKKMIRYYSGPNWTLEDNEYSSKSYIFLEQKVITVSNLNDSVIIYNAKSMPQDWVGSDLLEVAQISYQFIKQDNYGLLERIGDWFRFTSNTDLLFETNTLETEASHILSWMNSTHVSKNKQNTDNYKNMNTNTNTRTHTYKNYSQNEYRTRENREHTEKVEQLNVVPNNTLNTEEIKQNFQSFLIKYSVPIAPTVQHNIKSHSANKYIRNQRYNPNKA